MSSNAISKAPIPPATVADFTALLPGPDKDRGEAGLRAILEARPADFHAASNLARHLIRDERSSQAVDVARRSLEAATAMHQLLLAEALLAAGEIEEAREACLGAAALGPAILPRLQRGEILNRLGCHDEAAACAHTLRNALPRDVTPAMLLRLGRIAMEAGAFELARECLDDCLGRDDLATNQLIGAANAMLQLAGRGIARTTLPQLAQRLEERRGHDPENPGLCLALARLLHQLGRGAEAAGFLTDLQRHETLETPALAALAHALYNSAVYAEADAVAARALSRGGLAVQTEKSLINCRINSLAELGRFADASDVVDGVLTERQDRDLERKAFMLARSSGDERLIARAQNRALDGGEMRLPKNLADGLAAIVGEPAPPLHTIPPDMAIPWQLAGLPETQWQDWAARFSWGQQASQLLMDWVSFAGADRQGELTDLLLPLDDEPLRDLMERGGSLIAAGTHMGPVVAGIPYLTKLWPDVSIFGLGGRDVKGTNGIFLTERGAIGSVLAMRRRLEKGGIMTLLIDGVGSSQSRPVALAGTQIGLSPIVARLSRALSVPSAWFQPEWSEGRIRLRFQMLPVAQQGEDGQEWETRWFEAVTGHLDQFLRTSSPESTSGLNVLPKAAISGSGRSWPRKLG